MSDLRDHLTNKFEKKNEFEKALVEFVVDIDRRLAELSHTTSQINASIDALKEEISNNRDTSMYIPVLVQVIEEIIQSQIGLCNAASTSLTATQRNISAFELAGIRPTGLNTLTIGKKK